MQIRQSAKGLGSRRRTRVWRAFGTSEAGGAALACLPRPVLRSAVQVQSLDVNPNRFHRATIVGEFDFDEMEEEEEE